jgi:Ca2+/Na+ antiporter
MCKKSRDIQCALGTLCLRMFEITEREAAIFAIWIALCVIYLVVYKKFVKFHCGFEREDNREGESSTAVLQQKINRS